jgi:hypothetical protein
MSSFTNTSNSADLGSTGSMEYVMVFSGQGGGEGGEGGVYVHDFLCFDNDGACLYSLPHMHVCAFKGRLWELSLALISRRCFAVITCRL